MKYLFLLFSLLSVACVPAQSQVKGSVVSTEVRNLTIPEIPEWTDRYADGKKGDVRFFNLSKLMATYAVNRLEAVEIQNTYRDLTRANSKLNFDDALKQAVATVKGGTLESGVDLKQLQAAKFVVVFDLDDTVYDQYYPGGAACHTVAFDRGKGKMKYIKMAPGWADIFRNIVKLGGRVILFSANLDKTTLENLAQIKLDDKPLTESPLISGIMTNSHLTQQEKTEAPGSITKPRKGRPVVEPSKDLRHFDPTLKHVIIVDDNPLRLSQFRNVRVFKKFHADEYCTTTDPDLKASYDAAMSVVSAEIQESVRYMDTHEGVSFAEAYLPYSVLGQTAFQFISTGRKWSAEKTRDYLRKHPSIVDIRY
jgi:hypothetical protein